MKYSDLLWDRIAPGRETSQDVLLDNQTIYVVRRLEKIATDREYYVMTMPDDVYLIRNLSAFELLGLLKDMRPIL